MSNSESIIDMSRPSAGRMYDYMLGGHHNFEVDRRAADEVIKMLPFVPKGARFQRWCLQDLAIELTEKRGYDIIIDFASGLPTNDHIHHVVPEGTTVIYSDFDPVVVEYAREILADTPNVHFFQADARRPEELLNRPAVKDIIGDRRDVALVYWGLSAFLSDEDIANIARYLYDWADPASTWVFMAQGTDLDTNNPDVKAMMQVYDKIGSPLMFRTLSLIEQLVQPWHPDENNFISMFEWHGVKMHHDLTAEDMETWGAATGGYGAYLRK
ncbi:MAG TPA: SAM-dependent methyltransferase [Kouleothrix sp.]|nr:SAM-dependent methyltransferase [Kouleothrix sp.]